MVRLLVTEQEERVAARRELQLLPLDTGNALKADPVPARQREQWQFIAYSKSSATRYSTVPHSHAPPSIRRLPLTVSWYERQPYFAKTGVPAPGAKLVSSAPAFADVARG